MLHIVAKLWSASVRWYISRASLASIAFVTAVVDGDNLKSGSPAYLLRDRLLAEKQAKSLSPGKNIELFIKGWNAYRSGVRVSRLMLSGNIPPIAV